MSTGTIRPKPPEPEVVYQDSFDIEKLYKENWEAYRKAFLLQRQIQEKEIGCYFPVERYGGYRLLLKAIPLPDKLPSGLFMPDGTKDEIIKKYDIGLVIGVGPEAYIDRSKFLTGPRCKIGDWVDFSPFEKIKKIFNDNLCYIINDDRVNFPIHDIKSVVSELRKYN